MQAKNGGACHYNPGRHNCRLRIGDPMADGLDEHPLIRVLREAIRQANSDIYDLELAVKATMSNPAEVVSLFSAACISDGALWRRIVDRAYCHANGFAKFVLYNPAWVPSRLRLHVWTGEDTQRRLQEDQNVHGHRWNFGSAVIAGPGLHIEEFVVSEAGSLTSRTPTAPGRGPTVIGARNWPSRALSLRPSAGHCCGGRPITGGVLTRPIPAMWTHCTPCGRSRAN